MNLHTESIQVWEKFYYFHKKEKYVFAKKDFPNLKQLIGKVKQKILEQDIPADDEVIIQSFKAFLNTVRDQWILDHLEISLVNSKFNILYSNATRKIKQQNATTDYFTQRYSPQGTK